MPVDGKVGTGVSSPSDAHVTGASFTGTSGFPNRTYAMTPTPTHGVVQVFIDRTPMSEGTDFSVSGSTITITDTLDDGSTVDLFWW